MRSLSVFVLIIAILKPSPLNGFLPPDLQNVSVPYPETMGMYTPYSYSALPLLETEVHHLPNSVTLTITTSVTHWHNPLWHLLRGLVQRLHNQNQVLDLKSYFYVGDGQEMKCRVSQTNDEENTGVLSQDEYCQLSCTNGGRYCAAELPQDVGPTITGKMILEETLRRLCIMDIYHAEKYKFWDYLDAFEALECWTSHDDMGECATKALGQAIPSAPEFMHACMLESGGLEEDKENMKLQEQLDRQKQKGFSFEQMPLLEINYEEYQGFYKVDSIFEKVCQTYSETNDNVRPVACDFCENCDDVRHCLWYLQCDGTSFDPETYTSSWWPSSSGSTAGQQQQQQQQQSSDAPTSSQPEASQEVTSKEVTSNQAADNEQMIGGQEEEEEEDDEAFLYGGVVAGLLLGLLPAIYFTKRANRTRAILNSALATRAMDALEEGTFVDNLASSTGRGRPSPEELKDLDDVDIEITKISSMMVENGAPPKLAFLPRMT